MKKKDAAEKQKRKDKEAILDIVEKVTKIFNEADVKGNIDVYTINKPYLVEVSFSSTLPKVTQIMQACETEYGQNAELGVACEGLMVSPCTISYEYFIDITYDK